MVTPMSLKRVLMLAIVALACIVGSESFQPTHLLRTPPRASQRKELVKREVIPQLMFAAACAGAVFTYVATHIDEIKQKQAVCRVAILSPSQQFVIGLLFGSTYSL